MKKALALLLSVFLLVGFAACGGGASSAPAADAPVSSGSAASTGADEPAAGDGEQITLEFWTLALQPTFTDFIQGLIDKYEAENPNIKIVWQDLPWDGIQDKFLTQTAGGNPPDVINIWSQLALQYAGKGALLDLEANATAEQKEIYLQAAYDSARLGDSVYAFPWYATPNITTYNKDLLAQYGLEEAPRTYEELMDIAVDFKQKTGAYLFTPATVFHMFYNYGIEMVNEDGTKATFNTPEALALLTKLQEIGMAGAVTTETGGWDNWDMDRQLYANEMLAMVLGGPQTVTRLRDEAPEILEKTAIAESVMGPGNISGEAIMNLVVSSQSKHPQEAIAFANFITNDENQLAFCHEVSIFPTTKVASTDEYFQSDLESLEGQANYYASISAQHATDMTLGLEKDEDVKREIDNIMDAMFASGTSPQEALNNAEARVNEILAE